MTYAIIPEQNLTDIADAIRSKNGTQNTYTPGQMAGAISDIHTSEDIDHGGKYLIRVVDYDGTILKQDHLNTGDTFNMPSAPQHTNLVFQEWSSPVAINNSSVTVTRGDVIIGAIYTTADGSAEFDLCIVNTVPQTIYCAMVGNKDWGDGTSDNLTSHTYTVQGNYTLKCDGTIIPTNAFVNPNDSSEKQPIYAARLGNVEEIKTGAFTSTQITTIAFSNQLNFVEEYAIWDDLVVPHCLVFPQSTTLDSISFLAFYATQNIVLPITAPWDVQEQFSIWALSLDALSLPQVTQLNAILQLIGIRRLDIPSSVTAIGPDVFYGLPYCQECDFSAHTTIPSIEATTFSLTNPAMKIVVPDNLYDAWILSTNWASISGQIVKASEV